MVQMLIAFWGERSLQMRRRKLNALNREMNIFIGPESDHCLPLSLTHSLTDCRLVKLTDVTLACEDANSKLIDVVTVADDDCLQQFLQIWKLRFGQKAKLLF